jgi:hypothetical protein
MRTVLSTILSFRRPPQCLVQLLPPSLCASVQLALLFLSVYHLYIGKDPSAEVAVVQAPSDVARITSRLMI